MFNENKANSECAEAEKNVVNDEKLFEEVTEQDILEQKMETDSVPIDGMDSDSLPPGRYIAKIIYAELTQHFDEKYDILKIKFTLLGDGYDGVELPKVFHLKSKSIIGYLRKEFARMDIAVQTREDLIAKYPQILGKKVKLDIQYPNGSQVVYILGDDKRPEKKVDFSALWEL